jgi:hypothetical protein
MFDDRFDTLAGGQQVEHEDSENHDEDSSELRSVA